MKKNNVRPVSDYILIRPDKPEGGTFTLADGSFIDESGIVESVGERVSDEVKKLVGKRVLFNAWACDMKSLKGQKYYFAPESANCICAVI